MSRNNYRIITAELVVRAQPPATDKTSRLLNCRDERARNSGRHVRGQTDSIVPVLRSPGAIIFLLSALLFLSPASQSVGRAAVSWWLNMESGTNGAALTTSILNAATPGGSSAVGSGWSLFPGPTASTMVSMKVYFRQ